MRGRPGQWMRSVVAAACLWLVAGSASAERLDGCTDSGLLSRGGIISSFCFNCFFPIRIMGIPIPAGRGASKLPGSEDMAGPICVCPGRTGLPSIGLTFGMWQPTHLTEVVKTPFCSPVLLGMNLGGVNAGDAMGLLKGSQFGGSSHVGGAASGQDAIFYNYHWIKFPGAVLLDMLTNTVCAPRGGVDMDFGYLSELDPTMQNDLMANYTHPESRVFANPAAQAACMADTVMAATRRPISKAFWCAGSWGSLYPYSMHSGAQTTFEGQMLTAARGLAAMHRRGLAKRSSGNKAVCADRLWFVMPKNQYQFQNLWPRPRRSAEWIGTTEYKGGWGLGRVIPAVGEDRVTMTWAWNECCITAW